MKFDNKNIDRMPTRIELSDSRYPARVKTIMGSHAPKHLDMVGNFSLLDTPGIGVCGARKPSVKGLEIARDCAEQAVREKLSVISGNASGVDFESHFHSLKAGGSTILVLPEGINHFRIRKALRPVWDWDKVLVISQFEHDEAWRVFRAMTRNHLIIALSRVMIVIEAGERGGTFSACEEALKLKIPLFVAEHADMSIGARGNRKLLAMGARKFKKNAPTNRANLVNVFTAAKEDSFLKEKTKQGNLAIS